MSENSNVLKKIVRKQNPSMYFQKKMHVEWHGSVHSTMFEI